MSLHGLDGVGGGLSDRSGGRGRCHRAGCALVTVHEVATATAPMTERGAAGGICSFFGRADPSLLVYVHRYADTHSMATSAGPTAR